MTAQNQKIQFVPQGKNPVNEALKLSIAIKMLSSRLAMMQVIFDDESRRDQIAVDDWDEYIEACKFVNENGNDKYKFPTDNVDEYVWETCQRAREESAKRERSKSKLYGR